jgi:hypothetical protein
MSHSKILAALSVVLILGAAPAAIAKDTHKNVAGPNASTANASAAPRPNTHGFQTWCDTNPECNGWGDWLRQIQAGDRSLVTHPPGSK